MATILDTLTAFPGCLPVHFDSVTGQRNHCRSYDVTVRVDFFGGNRRRKVEFAGDSMDGARAVYRGVMRLVAERGYSVDFDVMQDGECVHSETVRP